MQGGPLRPLHVQTLLGRRRGWPVWHHRPMRSPNRRWLRNERWQRLWAQEKEAAAAAAKAVAARAEGGAVGQAAVPAVAGESRLPVSEAVKSEERARQKRLAATAAAAPVLLAVA